MKYYLILFLFPVFIFGQRIETEKVLKVADSIILSHIGESERIFKYFSITTGHFKYKNGKYNSSKHLLSRKKLKKSTYEIWVLYHFNYPEVEGVRGGTWVKLDKNLKLIEDIDLSFIPDFVWEKEPSNFITKQKALKIGIDNFENDGIQINEPILEFNKDYKKYTYSIGNVLTKSKNSIGKDTGEIEMIIIDAISGNFLERNDIVYGVIIR